MFNLSIGVNMLEDHFVGEAKAFVNHPSRRTTRVELITVWNNVKYKLYDVCKGLINEDPEVFPIAPPSLIEQKSDPFKEPFKEQPQWMEHEHMQDEHM